MAIVFDHVEGVVQHALGHEQLASGEQPAQESSESPQASLRQLMQRMTLIEQRTARLIAD